MRRSLTTLCTLARHHVGDLFDKERIIQHGTPSRLVHRFQFLKKGSEAIGAEVVSPFPSAHHSPTPKRGCCGTDDGDDPTVNRTEEMILSRFALAWVEEWHFRQS